ncbi:DUF4190 domain-containing protein [Thalassobacillus sp. B23F22_16]|uniref:DUF4190 domain-containing protein n=1 Tax=Thalassobacillus sp. B23F22_16 TaxID=3459513 RepID=UPI00373EA33D
MTEKALTNNKAITGLALGILSIIIPLLGLLCAIAGIFYYRSSRREIKVQGEAGINIAIAGFVCSILGLIIQFFYILALLAYYLTTTLT